MKQLLLSVLVILLSCSAKAQLMFRNTKSDTFQIAVVMHTDTKEYKGWISKGWFKLNPGDSAAVGALSGTSVYYFLHTTDNKISNGPKAFLVDQKDAFTIKGADQKSNQVAHPAYIWRNFYEIKVPQKAQQDGKLMIIL
jgi:uncharacterized membrane protein